MTTGTLLDDLFEVDPKRAAWYEELARRCEQHGNADTLQQWADPKQRALDLRRMRSELRLEIASEQEGEDFVSKQECIKTGVEKFDDAESQERWLRPIQPPFAQVSVFNHPPSTVYCDHETLSPSAMSRTPSRCPGHSVTTRNDGTRVVETEHGYVPIEAARCESPIDDSELLQGVTRRESDVPHSADVIEEARMWMGSLAPDRIFDRCKDTKGFTVSSAEPVLSHSTQDDIGSSLIYKDQVTCKTNDRSIGREESW